MPTYETISVSEDGRGARRLLLSLDDEMADSMEGVDRRSYESYLARV